MAILWHTLAPNMVVYFFAIVVITKLAESFMMRHNAVYRDHLSWHHRRKLISHAWLALTGIAGITIQCIAYLPDLFTREVAAQTDVKLLVGLSTIIIVVYMHDLAYTRANAALMVHHLATALALVLVVFSIDETNSVQTFAMFSTIMLMFETLSGTTYLAMIFHRLWGSPVPHPKFHHWAGVFMRAAAWWFVITRMIVYYFGITRFVEVVSLGPSELDVAQDGAGPVSALIGRWFWVWAVYFPVMLVALMYAHYHTAVVMFTLAKRYEKSSASSLQFIVVVPGKDDKDLLAT